MNRRGTREQNDISIIIGNLPKRLQKKIVEETGEQSGLGVQQTSSSSSKDITSNVTATQTQRTVAACSNEDVPSIDYFLQLKNKSNNNTAPVLEASGEAKYSNTSTVTEQGTNETNVAATDSSVIRGILRINAGETTAKSAKLVGSNVGGAARESGCRRTSNTEISAKQCQMPISPAHCQTLSAHPQWFKTMDATYTKELAKHYDSLISLMQRNAVIQKWQEFSDTHKQLQNIFMQFILHQLKFCCEQKVDTFFWKLLFYNVREHLKNQKSSESQEINNRTLSLIDGGLKFYTDLQTQLTAKYIERTTVTASAQTEERQHRTTPHKFEFIAKVATQKLLICLGDLSRYKVKHLQLNDYTEAAKYYQLAQRLIPSNGIPYNQLAIVAIHARKKFDAIYFHMRSLMSSNAICSARESLLVLFDEIRKKYEETEVKASPLPHHHSRGMGNKSMRKEIWVHPDGVRRLHRTNTNTNKFMTVNEGNRLCEMASDELLRRFTSLFLYMIGKLYTGIGMESIQEHQRKLLLQLDAILKRNSLIIGRSRILKTIALNIFILDHNMHKDTRREILYYSFNFCNQMFGLILRKCNELLLTLCVVAGNEDFDEKSFADINTLLQSIKIYTDWLTQNVNIWEPGRSEEHTFVDCWTELQYLFLNLQRVQPKISNGNDRDQQQQIILEEDQFLIGFTPLAVTAAKTSTASLYRQSKVNSTDELTQFRVRVAKILEFQHCYERNQKRLEAHEESHFILEELNSAIKNVFDNLQSDDDNSENIVVNGLNQSKSAPEMSKLLKANNVEDAQVTQLSKLKKELEAKTNVKKMYNAKLEEILKYVDSKLYIEVRPKYLLPDTNCFIDCLEDFERLIQEFRRYTLIIPLTVVKELDGLSKGVKLESYEKSLQKHRIHHFDDVSSRAKKSLNFIHAAKNNVKCATTKGSIINASLFALVEEENVSNDDKILATALALSKTMSTERNKEGKCFIQTELVLITTDRNLRVKALSRNLAVGELSEFLQWAKDCNT